MPADNEHGRSNGLHNVYAIKVLFMVGLYVTHYYTLQYLHIMHINISKTVYRISFDKYRYANVTHGGKTTKLKLRVNTNIRERT